MKKVVRNLSFNRNILAYLEARVVLVQMHVSENAVDIACRVIVSELPLLELLDGLIGQTQFGLACVAEAMQVFASRNLEVGISLNSKTNSPVNTFLLSTSIPQPAFLIHRPRDTYDSEQCENDERSHVSYHWFCGIQS